MSAQQLNQPEKRPYHASDKEALYQICLQTADAGQDASEIYKDPSLLGDLYVGPYLAFQPELARVLEDELGICGYFVAVNDTVSYQEWFLREWLPKIQKGRDAPLKFEACESQNDALLASLFDFSMYQPDWLPRYPAHFHIELIERAQGKGYGTVWMQELFRLLQQQDSLGVHLGMHPDNQQAFSFFKKMGFNKLEHADLPWEEVLYLGKDLKQGVF